MRKYLLAAVASVLLAAPAAQASDNNASCLIVIDGETIANGPCEFTLQGNHTQNGDFIVHINKGWAQVAMAGVKEGIGSWGANDEGDIHGLGKLIRRGACWQSDVSGNKVCVWKRGEKRYFVK
jgi:hypothetical protein